MRLILLAAILFVGIGAKAQFGCNPQQTLPGLYPAPDSIPCFISKCACNYQTIEFVMFDSVEISGIGVRVEYLIIDEILNLPCGIGWNTSKHHASTPNRFENQEKGCIFIYGITNDEAGQYKLDINVRAKVSLLPSEVPYNAEALGYRVDIRLIDNENDTCPALDTTANANLKTASCNSGNREPIIDCPFCFCLSCDTVGINSIASLSSFSLYPNPTTSTATISFTAEKPATYVARIVNIYGAEVSREELNVTSGLNVNRVDVSNLANGVYIYTITDGKNLQTQRFVVEK